MKKLLLLLVGVVVAFAAHADLYVRGADSKFGSFANDFDYGPVELVTYGTEKWYTFEAPEGKEFQVSKTKGGSSWAGFEANVLGKDGGETQVDSNTKQYKLKATNNNDDGRKFTFNDGYKYVRVKEDHSLIQISKVPFSTTSGGDTGNTNVVIYYDNSNTDWKNVNIKFGSNPSSSGEYGNAMTKVAGTNYYKYDFQTADVSGISWFLFNNGNWGNENQTGNVNSAPANKKIYVGNKVANSQCTTSDGGTYSGDDSGNGDVVKFWTNFYQSNKDNFEGFDFNADKEYVLTFTGTESNTKVGLHVNNDWRGAEATNLTYNGTTATYTMTKTSGGDILFASGLTGDVTFKLIDNGSSYSLQVSGGSIGGGNEDPQLPEGTKYYIMGDFTDVVDTPILLVPGNQTNRYHTTLKTLTGAWNSLIIFAETVENGVATRTYLGSNGNKLVVNNEYHYTNGSNTYIDVTGLNKDKTYKVSFLPVDGYVKFEEDNVSHGSYYLCGDINVWSDIASRNTENTDASSQKFNGYFTGEDAYSYLQDDPDNPWVRFKTKEEMDAKWKFQYVGQGPEGTTGTDWYRLNLKARGASDVTKHVGRLGGQFKIICKNLEGENPQYGVPGDSTLTYWSNQLKVGEMMDISYYAGGGGQNILLYNTTVEDAVLWFNPTDRKLFLLGKPNDLYVYYANNNFEGIDNPHHPGIKTGPKVYINRVDQYNNFPEVNPFAEYRYNAHGNDYFSPDLTNGNSYAWEEYKGEDGTGVYYYPYGEGPDAIRLHFASVWRKKIPASIIHRTPMGFMCSVRPKADLTKNGYENDATDVWFPRQRIECEDIWFVENSVNVYFRFADQMVQDSPATRVYFNAWLDEYDSNGSPTGNVKYLKEQFADCEMVKISNNSGDQDIQEMWDAIDPKKRIDASGNELTWFKAPVLLSSDFANSGYAMFASCYGGFYPTGGASASLGDRQSVALNGGDLYYVVGGSSSRVGILYSHLKGTFVKGDANVIQINAEFFAKDHSVFVTNELNTTIGSEVDYRFSVTDAEGNQKLGGANQWRNEPFIDWNVDGLDPGFYTVNVTVRKLVDGVYEYYSSNDIYPIFETR